MFLDFWLLIRSVLYGVAGSVHKYQQVWGEYFWTCESRYPCTALSNQLPTPIFLFSMMDVVFAYKLHACLCLCGDVLIYGLRT